MMRTYSSWAVVLLLSALVGCGSSRGPATQANPEVSSSEREDSMTADMFSMPSTITGQAESAKESIVESRALPALESAAKARVAESPQAIPKDGKKFLGSKNDSKSLSRRPTPHSLNSLARLLPPGEGQGPGLPGDKFEPVNENGFLSVLDKSLSTFSIDVDTASYSKMRMYLQQHSAAPPAGSVRIEEFINYFDYGYSPPTGEHPFAVHIEAAQCPWQTDHRLVRIGLKGKEIKQNRPASNLVFLLDVSGSMDYHNKLPLVKQGMKMLVRQLGENDRVAIVVYAGSSGLVLPSTTGDRNGEIFDALERLRAGGSTNGGAGIQLAYQTAHDNFIQGGTNRVILCSDGDFNVGVTSTAALVDLAEKEAKHGVFLSVLGFGVGNHNDAMLEKLSNKANGNYAFIDSKAEAKKVLVDQMSGTLVTIAKDVKIQVEFNPAHVASYRLIGYENRRLADRDFNDDKKDAGEIGAGHTVTALYELTMTGEGENPGQSGVDPLKYQKSRDLTAAAASGEMMHVKLRYKKPTSNVSTLLTVPVRSTEIPFAQASEDFRFAAAVASFGMLLKSSQYKGAASYESVLEIGGEARGDDRHGYRAEFLNLVQQVRQIVSPGVSFYQPPPRRDQPNHSPPHFSQPYFSQSRVSQTNRSRSQPIYIERTSPRRVSSLAGSISMFRSATPLFYLGAVVGMALSMGLVGLLLRLQRAQARS